ncbi:glycosyltransferase family 4 protein [bacterium]|nr:glycosyltransferase family 4 protein [bacterium]
MRIGIDARTILNPEKGDAIGAGHYAFQLIRHLLDMDKENEFVLFFDFRVREKDVKKFSRPNVKIKFYPFSDYKKYLPGAYSEILGEATLQKEKLDILHSTSPLSRIPMSYKGKCAVTFHDLSLYKIPGCFPRIRRIRDRAVYSLMARKADKIIAVSKSTKEDTRNIFKAPEDKIKVIYSGLDERFFKEPEVDSQKVLAKYGINKKYILFLGTLEPSKNITRLLEAFARFKKKCLQGKNSKKFSYQLVLAGKRGWLSQEYKQIAKDFGIAKDIVYTGYIIGDELNPLFKGAEFFVMPSLYEGFGMTVLEAFATQTPAIISNVSSLPEIAGEAAYFVNPLDVKEISEALWKFSQNEDLRNQYRQKGLEQARKFDWKKTARETLEVYKEMIRT